MDYLKGPRCGIENCSSRIYYFEDGLKFCKRGHQQEGQQIQPNEEDGLQSSQGRKSRQKKDIKEKVSMLYSGRQALELYLQSYQLILWKQCYALIHTIGFPTELETVVKDLWALRLQLLRSKFPDSDAELVFSSQAETETEAEGRKDNGGRKWNVSGGEYPSMIESLGICYLGMVLLRLPISLGEIYRWAIKEDIPFIRVIRFVPKVMKARLPPHYLKSLDTQAPLEPENLHSCVHKLVLIYDHHLDIRFPAINYLLLLFKHVRDLALPFHIFEAVRRISHLLGIDFCFPRPGSRQKKSNMPESKLLALLVVAVKLFHPFDSLNRQLKSPFELGVFTMDWDVWNESRSKFAKKASSPHKLERGKEMLVSAQDVMQMSGEQLDEYLDWCEKTWVDENHEPKKRGVPEQLLEMFPTGRADGSSPVKVDFNEENRAKEESIEENLRTIQKSLQVRELIPEKREGKSNVAIRRLGSFYKRYKTLRQLLPPARLFYEAAATLGCINLHSLLISVLQIENKLQLWRAKQLKDEKRRFEAEKLNGESGESDKAASSDSKTGEEGIVDSSDDFSDSSVGEDHNDLEMLNAENNT